jgi:hypothetical protein
MNYLKKSPICVASLSDILARMSPKKSVKPTVCFPLVRMVFTRFICGQRNTPSTPPWGLLNGQIIILDTVPAASMGILATVHPSVKPWSSYMPTSHEDLMVDDKTQLATLLWKLQILNREAAAYCGVQERTVYKWLAGDRKVPKSVLKLFELMLEQKKGNI